MIDIQNMPNKDLVDALEEGILIDKFRQSKEWQLIDEACKRVVEVAQEELLTTKADDTVKVIELQQVIKLYRNVLKSIVGSFSQQADIAFKEAKEREIIKKK